MVELTTEQFEAAKVRGEARLCGPRAERAHYDAGRGRMIVRLTTSVEIGFAPQNAEGLQNAKRDDLPVIEVNAFGLGIYFPRLNADFYVRALLEGALGSKAWMTAKFNADTRRHEGSAKPTSCRGTENDGRQRKVSRPARSGSSAIAR